MHYPFFLCLNGSERPVNLFRTRFFYKQYTMNFSHLTKTTVEDGTILSFLILSILHVLVLAISASPKKLSMAEFTKYSTVETIF